MNANDEVALANPRLMPLEVDSLDALDALDPSDNRQATPLAGRCIHELFQQRVAEAPNSTAVVFEEQQLTYGELNSRANQLARYLRRHGVGPEVLVGICIERSLEMIVGLLGILKAGGAYVPLDPAYPQHRLQFMLEDSEATLLLTQRTLLESLPAGKAHPICLDENWEKISFESAENIESQAAAGNLAYVIYTSGSTGKPKGVAIEHRSAVALIDWANTVFLAEELDGVLASTSICFDLSIFELFVTLGLGGCVVLADNALQLANLKAAKRVTLINTVPSAIAELLRMKAIPETVRTINLAGEPLKTSVVKQIYELGHVQRVFDLYGPSEDTTYSTYALRLAGGPATIGRAISNTKVHLLDAELNPVPEDAAGEIYLSGQGLARGYLKRPDLTAERFVPNPSSAIDTQPQSNDSRRLYRSGDLGRYLADGNLEYLGRVDNQIKLRGFRIELREIELRLAQYPSIQDCVVVVREDARGEKFLAAYLVADEAASLTELRVFLKEQLPDYMIPSTFVYLDKLPLTANGKIDRQALPEPPTNWHAFQDNYVAPKDDIEIELTKIWEEILGLTSVGTQADFFELGGHSLMAVRLFAEIEKKFGRKLPLATLFESGTISKLATILRQGCSPSWNSLIPMQPNGSKPPLFCIHSCGAHVFIYRPMLRHLDADQPVYGVQPFGLDGQQEPYTHIGDMTAHYIREIRGLQPHGPYQLVGDTLGGLFAFDIAQQLVTEGEEVALLAMFDTSWPLPLSFGPRMASHLYHLKELGVGKYLLAGADSVRRKLLSKFGNREELMLTDEAHENADRIMNSGDPLQRTEWAIYLASIVNYQPPKRRYPGKITYFMAEDNVYKAWFLDDRLHWKKAARELEVHSIPGRHDTLREEPYVVVLAEKLKECLSKGADSPQRTQRNTEEAKLA